MLPTPDGSRLLDRSIAAMERLRSARMREALRSRLGGTGVVTRYRFSAPAAFAVSVRGDGDRIVIGRRQFARAQPSAPWRKEAWPGPPFRWPRGYYRSLWAQPSAARLLGWKTVDGARTRVVTFVRAGLPAWFRLWVGVRDHLVRREQMLAEGHLMTHVYSGFDRAARIHAPR
jgi:hypothetical protein